MPNYTNSSMVQVVKLSPYHYNGRFDSNVNPNGKIDRITIHHMAGVLTADTCGEVFQKREASANYGIGSDGKIGLYVEEKNGAWSSNSWSNDCRAVTIEVSNSKAGGDWPVSSKSYEILIDLCADICKRNGIKRLNYTGDTKGNLTMHCWFHSTACPGPYLKSRFSDIALKVNRKLGDSSYVVPSTGVDVSGETISDSYTTASTGYLTVDNTLIQKYMVTIDRYTDNLDYDKLKALGVIGVNIEGGHLFDESHNVVEFRNPKLMKQVEQCKKEGLPYSLYVETRSNTLVESVSELYEIQLLLATYPPDLGLWVVTHFTDKNKTKNNAIMDLYTEYLIQFGLKSKIGLYVGIDQLKTIEWDKHSENWYLWLVDKVSSTTNMDELVTPQFFDVDLGEKL